MYKESKSKNINIMSYEKKDKVLRFALKDEMLFRKNIKEGFIIKHVTRGHEIIQEIYNKNDEIIGIDILNRKKREMKTIYVPSTGKTIVILKINGKEYKGVSKCRKEDIYDSQIGFDLALCRAKIKYNEEVIKSLIKL